MKQSFVVLLFFIASNTLSAQQEFGVKINGGVSRISFPALNWEQTIHVYWVPSGNASLTYKINLGSKSTFGTELLFSQIEGKESIGLEYTDTNGNYINPGDVKLYKHISYLGIPFYYGLGSNKFSFSFGGQILYALRSKQSSKSNPVYNGQQYSFNSTADYKIKKVNYGFRMEIAYELSKKLRINALYYYGLNDIAANDFEDIRKIQLVTMGVQYLIYTKEPKKDAN